MSQAFISLGSNQGDRSGFLVLAIRGMLDAGLPVHRLSQIYETEPVGVIDQPKFLNMVAELRGELPTPEQLLARLLRIEFSLGRTREKQWGPRTIDLDLLVFDHECRQTEFLTLPHPRLHQRLFVLAPLGELAPDLIVPGLKGSVNQLKQELKDETLVELWIPERGLNAE
jgi:2-amino-4-hydroxy-6-hydroxymethyldihydropteridine diphosphokinase